MAYWGEAMTHNHGIWNQLDAGAGRAALAKLAATPQARAARAPTAREKAYLGAVEILYEDKDDKKQRDARYSDAMQRLAKKFPHDNDAQLFAALCGCDAASGVSAQSSQAASGTERHPTSFGDVTASIEFGLSRSASVPASPALVSLDARFESTGLAAITDVGNARLHGRQFAGLGLAWRLGSKQGPAFGLGMALARRSVYLLGYGAALGAHERLADGVTQIDAEARVSGGTPIRATTLLATLQIDGREVGPAARSVFPWVALAVGVGHIKVQAQTALLEARLQLRGPGFEVNDRFSRGELHIRQHASNDRAWQAAAGLGWRPAPGNVIQLGLRYADLGRYRTVDQASEWRIESQGALLRMVFPSSASRLVVREQFVTFSLDL